MFQDGQILGDFEILGRLGQGGMGAVYKARQVSLKRFVALKTLQGAIASDPEYIARFHREAIAAAGLNHPNLVQVYAAGENDGLHWFAMEYVEGESAQDRLKRRGRIEPAEAIAIAMNVATALDHGWRKAQLIHRDIKPDNIFLSSDGEVKLGDLGLAKSTGEDQSLTTTGASMGTPHYVSPEQAEGKKDVDLRADIYSLGCTLYHLLTGQAPYSGETTMSVMMKHITAPVPDIRKAWPECPPALAAVVTKTMQKSPAARQQTHADLSTELRRAYDALAAPPKKPKPALAWIAGGVAVLAALAALFYFAPWKKGDGLSEAERAEKARAAENSAQNSTTKTATTPAAALPADGWKPLFTDEEWKHTSAGKREFVDGRVRLLKVSARKPQPSADGAIRARIWFQEGSQNLGLTARAKNQNELYKINFRSGSHLTLASVGADGKNLATLGSHILPKPLKPGDKILLELRLQGDLISAAVDGTVVIRGRDTTYAGPGSWGILADDGWYESVEVQTLGPASAPAPAAGAGEHPAGTAAPATSATFAAATKDAPYVNSLGMKFVPVPITGGPTDGQRVLFSVWETRVQDYEAFAKETVSIVPSPFPQEVTHPVTPKWEAARAFCAWLTDRERKAGTISEKESYRMPHDHEWSCAVGIGGQEDATKLPVEKDGGFPDVFPWGRGWPPPAGAGNYLGEENRPADAPGAPNKNSGIPPGYTDGYLRTAPVGSFAANLFGLYDLGGNVWEWCEEWSDAKQDNRTSRGGAWDYSPRSHLLSSKRSQGSPTKSNGGVGFRVVLATSPSAPVKAAPATPDPTTQKPPTPTPAPATPTPAPAPTPTPAPAAPAAQSVTGKWLAEQEAGWQAAFAKEVAAPFEKGVGDLNRQYLAAVETQLAAVTKAAKLDDAVAFRAERERLTSGGEMPAEDEAQATPLLKKLRASYRTAFAKLDTERFAKAKTVHARTDTLLAQNLALLTQRQRLDEALEIKARREALAAAWLKPPAGAAAVAPVPAAPTTAKPPATPKPAIGQSPPPPPSKAPKLKHRDLVERLLAMGAVVKITQPGGHFVVKDMTQYPGDTFPIQTVEFRKRDGLTETDLEIVEQLETVPEIYIERVPATDTTMEKLRRFPALKSLTLHDLPALTVAGFKSVAAMPELTTLDLAGPIAPEGLATLGSARKLRTLRINEPSFTEQDFAAIADIRELKDLSLASRELVPAAVWAQLASAKNLISLDVKSPINAEVIAQIGKLAGLERLTFGGVTLPDADLAPLAALKSLQSLRTDATSTLDGSFFATWPLRPSMKSLTLGSKRSVKDDTLRAIATAFPKLTRLDVTVSAGSVTTAGFSHLPKLRQLGYLMLDGDAVDDAGLAQIAKCELIYGLNLSNARVTEAGVHSLTKLPSLRELFWSNPPVTDAALKSYGKLRALTLFKIDKQDPPETEQKLKAALPKVKVVR